jgi:hypothetical protein
LHPTRKGLLLFAAVALFSLTVGCGGKKATVTGKVSYGGKTVPYGTVTFHPEKGQPVTVPIEDGVYTAKNVPTGDAKVTVETQSVRDSLKGLAMLEQQQKMLDDQRKKYAGMKDTSGKPPEQRGAEDTAAKIKEMKERARKLVDVPATFSKKESSGVSLTVKSGSQDFDVELSKK